MTSAIERSEVQRRLEANGHQLIEVLPREAFDNEHLPGASNIPLADLGQRARRDLDPAAPVIVYCWDHL